ncbi:LysM peptidoglycan-binding domain-containing protein [Mammaliicoccus stepanovicii]|uniref:SceD-like transglycosylase, biomarker for vancomycin-intermediate strains n=1 Tax=Mammaliicoccus stepanovicii TaxID=643214 RepID=A0A239YNJ7_9STAP|nr:LysM peptidoglycan-binding domain-containing protein [Mammaliicoccus stepanovicii]PNZ78936.1 hypothetical protein CD111_01910 [Mammaliicoccus stepanovicii]GGI41271.1 hypothetical protein GCM10010896_12530 [Mammaliicoccus stepanovicii]SNV60545.1 SceD-like transglycosylase, biomarker for vancomycin-intermediate strains [Mammaliicoccus stepanovicii]
MKKLLAVSTAAVAVTTGVTATADAATHTVKSGDTLHSISQQYGTSVDAIKSENGLKSNLILPNQVIKVNEAKVESTTSYTVVAGDTLGKIASKYDVTVSQLKAWNNLSSDLIIVGQKLSLQAPAQSAAPVAQAPAAQQAPVQQSYQAPAQQQTYNAPVQSYKAPAQQSYNRVQTSQTSYQAPAQHSTGSSVNVNSHLQLIAQRESGGNIHAINPTSGAAGKYQFLQSTWDSVAPAQYRGVSPANAPEHVQDAAAVKLYNTAGPSQWVTA